MIDPGSERRRLWQIEATDLSVVDLRDAATVRELGVDVGDLVGDRRAAQALADRARDIGAEGMVVPSAARHGYWNLVVFPSGLRRLAATASRAMTPRPPG